MKCAEICIVQTVRFACGRNVLKSIIYIFLYLKTSSLVGVLDFVFLIRLKPGLSGTLIISFFSRSLSVSLPLDCECPTENRKEKMVPVNPGKSFSFGSTCAWGFCYTLGQSVPSGGQTLFTHTNGSF